MLLGLLREVENRIFRVRFLDAIAVVPSALRVRPSFVPRHRIIVRDGYKNTQQCVVINEHGLMMGHLVHGMPRDRWWASMGATGHRDTNTRLHVESAALGVCRKHVRLLATDEAYGMNNYNIR